MTPSNVMGLLSLSVAAHEVLHLVGVVTGFERVGGAGAQIYDAYPGEMAILEAECDAGCEYVPLTSTGAALRSNLIH